MTPAFAVRSLHQIEITSRCNLACPYCLHPIMARPKLDMTRETWERALVWLRAYRDQGDTGEVMLTGTGEPLLHPDFLTLLREARETIGPTRDLSLTTNGLLVTEALVEAMVPYRPQVWVSLHRPEKAALPVKWLSDAGLLVGISTDAVTAPNDWGGLVNWHKGRTVASGSLKCFWFERGWMFCTAEGDLAHCCYANGQPDITIGHVREDPRPMAIRPHGQCRTCWQRVPEPWETQTRMVTGDCTPPRPRPSETGPAICSTPGTDAVETRA